MNTHIGLILILSVGLGACASSTYTNDAKEFSNATRGDSAATEPSHRSGLTRTELTPTSMRVANPQQPANTTSEVQARRTMPWEFAIGGVGVSNDNVDAGAAQLAGSVGYYFNEVVEVSMRQSAWFSDAGKQSPDVWNGTTRAAIDIHFPFGRFVPYVGANLGYAYGDTIVDTWMGGPETGVKIYLKDDAFLQAGVEYQFFFDRNDTFNSAFDDGQLLYGISLGLRF